MPISFCHIITNDISLTGTEHLERNICKNVIKDRDSRRQLINCVKVSLLECHGKVLLWYYSPKWDSKRRRLLEVVVPRDGLS